jgi:RHH-type proline utilization regulon transcriptional repressor/proline dehydrogenase/delta 1-pyrroline-5-carboxylate dehydrogenase
MLLGEIRGAAAMPADAAPLVNGVTLPGIARQVRSPIDGSTIGEVREADAAIGDAAIAAAADGFPSWTAWPVEQRAAALERAADRIQSDRGRLLALLQNEAGKTLDDALAELREAVDYCRYYPAQARMTLVPQAMPGPTGESNDFCRSDRGGARCRQHGRRQTRRADPARRCTRNCASA